MNSLFHPSNHPLIFCCLSRFRSWAAVGAKKHSLASPCPPLPAHLGDTEPIQRQLRDIISPLSPGSATDPHPKSTCPKYLT